MKDEREEVKKEKEGVKEERFLVTKFGRFNIHTEEYTNQESLYRLSEQAVYQHTNNLLYLCGGYRLSY